MKLLYSLLLLVSVFVSDAIANKSIIVKEQSFMVEIKNFGRVKFESSIITNKDNIRKPKFVLQDTQGNLLLEFPELGYSDNLQSIVAVSFPYLNSDGRKDIIIILKDKQGDTRSYIYFTKNDKDYFTDSFINHRCSDLKTISAVKKYINARIITNAKQYSYKSNEGNMAEDIETQISILFYTRANKKRLRIDGHIYYGNRVVWFESKYTKKGSNISFKFADGFDSKGEGKIIIIDNNNIEISFKLTQTGEPSRNTQNFYNDYNLKRDNHIGNSWYLD